MVATLWFLYKQLLIFCPIDCQVGSQFILSFWFFFFPTFFFFLILFPSPVSNFLYTYLDWFYFVVTSVPQSSYRLGVKASKLHELFPDQITEALQHAVSMFEKEV